MLISTELRFERRANVGLQGANSQVYFAWDHQLNAELVVKQIKKASISDPAEYFAEASLLYDTRHPNVVDVKYSCADADHVYLAMPKYEGSLHQVLLQRALTVREIVKVGLDMLSGLHHVHAKGLVHFDVKPSNILLEPSGRAAVSDFGLSRPVDQHGLATPVAMYEKHFPPEYLTASTALSSAADVYQAGLTLYRMCVGLGHFDYQLHLAKQAMGTNWPAAVVTGQFPSRHNYPAHISNRLRSLIMKALEPNPADRFHSILAMQNELSRVDEYLDWQFDPSVPGTHQWHLEDGTHQRTVMDEPDGGGLRKISVRRVNLVNGVTNNLSSLGASGLSVAKATAMAQAAFVSQSATTP
jgi:serine/threonine protein kinase